MTAKIGLRQRILAASTVSQIEALLLEGKTFKYASDKTRRSWVNAAKRRTLDLQKA